MDRLFCTCLICAALLIAPAFCSRPCDEAAQPVFFSLLFPQLSPFEWLFLNAEDGTMIVDAQGAVFL